jgi:hypothetical protein
MADFGISEGIMLGVAVAGAAVSTTTSLMGASSQAAAQQQQAAAQAAAAQAQQQQAENSRAIAQYNADIQRQNNEVAYQMALYQAQYAQQAASVSQAMAVQNQQFAEQQALMAKSAYQQQLQNAENMRVEADAKRRQSAEEADRQREKNDAALATIRAKSAAGGVTFEGSPLVVLSDAARLGETIVRDLAYTGEMESRKTLGKRTSSNPTPGSICLMRRDSKWRPQISRCRPSSSATSRTSMRMMPPSPAQERIDDNYASLVELGGEEKAFSYEFAAQQSLYALREARCRQTPR